ncbi:BMC domain-containing protein [Evansella sp. AB-rgal1]|uniref:BMC domain-containing protein n=1 Tax=Evansella sp. AB-rgal1 TaxID=3242696 RepID=UPI00359EED47
MTQALGMIEVAGLVAAIDTADTMAKVANISIVEMKKTRGNGWMTIFIEGDVASVQAAIATGEQYSREKNQYVSSKVIPRPAADLKETLIVTVDHVSKEEPEEKTPAKKETKPKSTRRKTTPKKQTKKVSQTESPKEESVSTNTIEKAPVTKSTATEESEPKEDSVEKTDEK